MVYDSDRIWRLPKAIFIRENARKNIYKTNRYDGFYILRVRSYILNGIEILKITICSYLITL